MIMNSYKVLLCVVVGLFCSSNTADTGCIHFATGLSAKAPPSKRSLSAAVERRTFVSRIPFAIISASTAMTNAFGMGSVVRAYERRDVGGPDASPETKAMNLQAYETNNRLERDGVKLETAEEQSAKLTAALSEYSYSPTGAKDTKKKGLK